VAVTRQNLLGEFLRAQRERMSPEQLGLPGRGSRRVTGLRREELALLADVSETARKVADLQEAMRALA
jgi:hypothetical protein